jgi:hypothetical protein
VFVAHRAASAEYFHNPGLRSKFDWVQDEPWLGDLKNGKVKLRQGQKDSIADTLEYLKDGATTLSLGCSEPDERCLATALELSIPLATDDTDLKTLAEAFDATVLSSLGVLKQLVDHSAIDIALVRKVVLQWQADDDFRPRFWKEYAELFGEPCPKVGGECKGVR